jgi:DNA repair protein RecO (recombination protein O)
MRERKTEAVILDTTEVFDTDRSYLLFSREYGKVRARGKGVRRPGSRLSGHLLPYLPIQLELVETGEWFLIVQAQMLSQYTTAGGYPDNSLLFLQQAGVVAEAMNRLFIDKDPHPEVYDGLVFTLDRLRDLCSLERVETAYRTQMIAAEFLLKCLAELGYRPELFRCVVTGEELQESFLGWSSRYGGLLSEAGYRQVSNEAFPLTSSRTVVALRQFLEPNFVAERLNMPEEVQKEVARIIFDYLQNQIGQPLRSLGIR